MALLSRRSLARWAVGMLAVQVLVLVLSPSYFSFYAAYPAPALALASRAAWPSSMPGSPEHARQRSRARRGRGVRHSWRSESALPGWSPSTPRPPWASPCPPRS
ncbi:hypothetical protein [Nocardioides ungokensis]|uniref:hypothetical protein n=1 Tax=Nocardioides ungokensis TaxID=1643322 RepID=UPI0015DD792D|nr:hypothetical protein [Nocardioides ungokensis]